jgi:hypothetical protein
MEAKRVIHNPNFQCNLCEGYQFVIVEDDKKVKRIEKCMKCYGTGIGNL